MMSTKSSAKNYLSKPLPVYAHVVIYDTLVLVVAVCRISSRGGSWCGNRRERRGDKTTKGERAGDKGE